mgnify:CR=1 FL=1
MLKKTVTYTDYNGVERTEDFYFNLTRSELIEMHLTTEGGMEELRQEEPGRPPVHEERRDPRRV